MKTITVKTSIARPTITFVAEKIRVFSDGYSYDAMAYTPRFDELKMNDYRLYAGMDDKTITHILEDYMVEEFGLDKGMGATGAIDWYCYSGKEVRLPELPKLLDSHYNDDHKDLVNMFKDLEP